MERRFSNIDAGHSDCLIWHEPWKHREEVDVGIGQHARPQVGELGLGPIIVCEDVTQRAPLVGTNQSTALVGVPDKVVKFPLVCHQPPSQPSSISLAALREFADDGAGLVSTVGQPDLSLILEGDDHLPDFEGLQQARLCQEGKKLCRGPTAFGACEMPSKSGRDDRMAVGCELPFLNLGKSSANVFWKRAIDGYMGHAVSWMSEALEIGFRFTHAPEWGGVAGLYVDADDFPRIVVHRVPEPTGPMLHTSLLDVREEASWGWLPAVLFFCHNGGRVVFAEGSVSKLRVAQFGADRLESFVGFLCPVGAAVLEHELVDRAQEPDP